MHILMPPPPQSGRARGEVADIRWGLDSQDSHCPREFDRRLWHKGRHLRYFSEKTEEIVSKFEGCFNTKLSHMSRELDNFTKLPQWGSKRVLKRKYK